MTINVKDYGAVGNWNPVTQTGHDDTSGINEAIDKANGTQRVYFPPGNYRTTSPLITAKLGTFLEGEGGFSGASRIYADHLSGPVIRVAHRNVSIVGLALRASAARASAPFDNVNYGLLLEGPDIPAFSYTRTFWRDVEVRGHPGHGAVITGMGYFSIYEQILSTLNKGHGFVIDGGEVTGRTHLGSPGMIQLSNSWAIFNGGHSLVIGNPAAASTPFRILVHNVEQADNASDEAVRFTPDEAWVYGANIEVRLCAFGPTRYVPGRYGIRVAGQCITVENNRYVNLDRSVTLSGDVLNFQKSAGSIVRQARVFGTQPVGVVIEPGCVQATVDLPMTSNMTVPVQDHGGVGANNIVTIRPEHDTPPLLEPVNNDYDWKLGKRVLRLTAAPVGSTITGFGWPTAGRQLRILNIGSRPITLAHQSPESSPGNRILSPTGTNIVIGANGTVDLEYDGSGVFRWRITAGYTGSRS